MPIQTVLFDMGGTIETFWYSPEMRLAATPDLQATMAQYGINLPCTDLQLYKLITDGLARYHEWRRRTLDEIPASLIWRNYILADYPKIHSQLDAAGEDLMVWIETHYYQRQMRPEMPEVLSSIRKMGYKIGLISNVASLGQVPINLDKYGIKHFFHPIVLSSEYKRRKPDPSIFHYAARLSNSPTSECIYIGDRISRDVLGAKRAGFKLAIQIKHNFVYEESDEGAIPDLIIENMSELLEVLEQDSQSITRQEKSTARKIKAVLFDADGVLYYRKKKEQELNAYIRKYGSPCSDNPLPEINELRHKAFIGELTFEQYKTKILNIYGITNPQLVSRGIEHAAREKEKIHFFNDTRETLEFLKSRNLYLGIVTDTAQPLNMKIDKLERGGIGHLWDSITPSREVGVQKPHPKIYQLALEQLGISAENAIFVGHKASELTGAKNIGITTVAYNYDADAKADIYIEKFSDLANLDILN